MQPWHVTLVARGRHTLFPDPHALTRAVRSLARIGAGQMLTFSIVDDHAHIVVNAESRAAAGYFASGVSRALVAVGSPQLESSHVREVDGRAHLESLVGYLARQPMKHGLPVHPALAIGSASLDLLGARRLPGFDPSLLAAALPRANVAGQVARVCGVPRIGPAPDEQIASLSPSALWMAALAAGGVAAFDRDPHAVAVRVAWATFASGPHELPVRTFQRSRARRADPHLVDAIRRRVAVEAVATAPADDRWRPPEGLDAR